jgi:hypothetical protein
MAAGLDRIADAIYFEPELIRLEVEMKKLVRKLLEKRLGGNGKAALGSSAVRRASTIPSTRVNN